MRWIEAARRSAAREAVKLLRDNFCVGLGSGSTISHVVTEIRKRVMEEKLRISVVPTSHQTELLAIENELNLASLSRRAYVDLAIDGADWVEVKSLNLIKGGGAALTREKIVDSAAKSLAIVVDEEKLTDELLFGHRVPIEVIPFGFRATMDRIQRLRAKSSLREVQGKVGPVITDNGNFIVDALFTKVYELGSLDKRLKLIPGVVETGLFIGMADYVYVGRRDGTVRVLKRKG